MVAEPCLILNNKDLFLDNDSLFANPDHLNPVGAERYTSFLKDTDFSCSEERSAKAEKELLETESEDVLDDLEAVEDALPVLARIPVIFDRDRDFSGT